MIVVGETGLARWSCGRGTVSPGDVDVFVRHIRETRPRPGLVMVDLMHDISTPSASERRQIADAVRDTLTGIKIIAGHVVVTNSPVARGVLTAVNWIVKTPFPETTSSTPAAGLAWARAQSPALDVDAVLAEINAQVPWWSGLRW